MTQPKAWVLLMALLMTTMGLAGCIGDTGDQLDQATAPGGGDAFDKSRGWSVPTTPALYDVLPGVKVSVPSFDGTEISLGIFHPEVPGCDWKASELPEECRFPVVVDAGPYYLDGVDEDRMHPPTIEWLVPRGYHVVQMSLRGTGESGGCYEFKNPEDVRDVDAVIGHLVEQPWSTEAVGMTGRSYDGTGAWSGAASGNEHLRTVLPIAGAVDGPDLYYKNGTAESRSLTQPRAYYPDHGLGLGADDPSYRVEDWPQNVCLGQAEDWTRGPKAGATGDASSDYWQSRDLTGDILEGYRGSVWVVHGLQDFNVNPSQVVPFTREMHEAGIETRAWLGQWGHAFPDFPNEHPNVRWDFAQRVLEWMDWYLKGQGQPPQLGVEVEDSLFTWRLEETYPPTDATWEDLELSADMRLAPEGEGEEGTFILTGPPTGLAVQGDLAGAGGPHAVFTSEPLEGDFHVAGLPRLHVEVTPTTPEGGQLFAELYDVFPDGPPVRIGWAAMDLSFHDGGNTDPATLTPGEPVLAKMQFEPMDAHVGEGHVLRLVLHKAGVEGILPSANPETTELTLGAASTLWLPTVDRPAIVPSYTPPGLEDPVR